MTKAPIFKLSDKYGLRNFFLPKICQFKSHCSELILFFGDMCQLAYLYQVCKLDVFLEVK